MTITHAISLYNKATNSNELERTLSPAATQAVSDILETARLCKNMGSELMSRQVIAAVIHMSKAKLDTPA